MFKNKKILITGHSGYKGSLLSEYNSNTSILSTYKNIVHYLQFAKARNRAWVEMFN